MLAVVAQELEQWIIDENAQRRADGLPLLGSCEIKVFGQAALLEQGLPLSLAATQDVDARTTCEHAIERALRRLLEARGKLLEAVGREAWMPRETRYNAVFSSTFVTLLVAEPEAIILSKALKAPSKNANLVTQYLALGASERFFQLAARYNLNLEQFV